MKRSSTLAIVSGALLSGAVLLPLTVASADGGSKRVHLELIETSTAVHVIDVAAPASDGAAGDLGIFESDLSQGGAKTGSLEGHCILIRADASLDDCDVTVTVGDNSFRMSGPFDPASGGTLTITGGTGTWTGAGGTDRIVNQPDGTAVHTIELVRR